MANSAEMNADSPGLAERWILTAMGALFGVLGWIAIEADERAWLGDNLAQSAYVLIVAWGWATLAMAGPLGIVRALGRGLALALVVAALTWSVGLRFDEPWDALFAAPNVWAVQIVAVLPVPFILTGLPAAWRDYPQLFHATWSLILRFAVAVVFAALIWGAVVLLTELLLLVGIDVVDFLTRQIHWAFFPLVVIGTGMGLATGVVNGLSRFLSPTLTVRLLRLLLPVVLVAGLLFLLALALRGWDEMFLFLSPAMLMTWVLGSGILLVSLVVAEDDGSAAESLLLRWSAQGMALILPIVAGVGLWALWLRVDQYGLTPGRLFLALTVAVGLAHALAYAAAVVRGRGWMGRIRRANMPIALVALFLAGLWLTPVLNAERLSAENHLARFERDRAKLRDLDVRALNNWGRAGSAAVVVLTARSKEPGQEMLADQLAGKINWDAEAQVDEVAALVAILPLQPPTATAARDALLAGAAIYQLRDWHDTCLDKLEDGSPACLMVIADLLPARRGDEALMFLEYGPNYSTVLGLSLGNDGRLVDDPAVKADGTQPTDAAVSALLRSARNGLPPVTAAPVNQLGTGEDGLLIPP